MILIIDNYDSFVHNLARYAALAGWVEQRIVRNDRITVEEVEALNPAAIIISPGPCTPKEAGVCVDLVRRLGACVPVLGVCLGHQCIAEAYGDKIFQAKAPVHGKAEMIVHDGQGVFEGVPSPFPAGRYHSLIVDFQPGSPLEVTARTASGEIMGLKHKEYPVYGVQFHPESVLTIHGLDIIRNFKMLSRCG